MKGRFRFVDNFQSLNVSIFQIRLFLAVAEEESFSRAAVRMHIEQSTLSRRISMLEQELGLQLFRREARPIQLTKEGKFLYKNWKPMVSTFSNSLEMAKALKGNPPHKLAMGNAISGQLFNYIPILSRAMLEESPDLTLTVEYLSFSQWRPKLMYGELDFAITVIFEVDSLDERFCWAPIDECQKLVCMLHSNPLSKKKTIQYEDLRDQKFIMFSDDESKWYRDYVTSLCHPHGFEPKIAKRVNNAYELASALQHDNEVLICDKYLRGYDNPLFKHYELPDTKSGICAIWLKENQNQYIPRAIEALRKIAQQ